MPCLAGACPAYLGEWAGGFAIEVARVMASAVNPCDIEILGGIAEQARQPPPPIRDIEIAGVVVAVGMQSEAGAARGKLVINIEEESGHE